MSVTTICYLLAKQSQPEQDEYPPAVSNHTVIRKYGTATSCKSSSVITHATNQLQSTLLCIYELFSESGAKWFYTCHIPYSPSELIQDYTAPNSMQLCIKSMLCKGVSTPSESNCKRYLSCTAETLLLSGKEGTAGRCHIGSLNKIKACFC